MEKLLQNITWSFIFYYYSFIYLFILIQCGTCLKLDYKFIGSGNLHFGQVLCASCYSMEMVNINHHDNINK